MLVADNQRFLSSADSAQLVRSGQTLMNLYRRYTPTTPKERPNWEVFSLACLARSHYTLNTILGLQSRELDAIALTRSLFEHVVTFAWLAIDPDRHYPMFVRWELNQRVRMCADLEKFGAVAPSSDVVRQAMVDAAHDPAPETADRALQAENYWRRAQQGWEFSFRRTYANLFRPYSAYVHPTVMGIDAFVKRSSVTAAAVEIEPRELDLEYAASAVASFADGLVVASQRLRWPPLGDLLQIFTHGLVER